jgi:hypothetical protein
MDLRATSRVYAKKISPKNIRALIKIKALARVALRTEGLST